MKYYSVFLIIFLVSPFCWSRNEIRLASFGAGYANISAFGSNYEARSTTVALLTGSLTWGISERLALRFLGDISPDGQTAYLGGGINFYSTPPYMSTTIPNEGTRVTQIPLWSHYVGASFGINRIQIALARTDAQQSDVVLAAMLGPSLHIGSLQSWGQRLFISYEAFYRYSMAPPLGSSEFGVLISPTFQLP